ncbi:MAG: carbohydrate ABC transporter permease [Bacillota bacterium]
MKSSRGNIFVICMYVLLAVFAAATLYPVLWMVFGSLKTEGEIYSNVWGPPALPRFANYLASWRTARIGTYVVNSILVTFPALFLLLAFACMAAYAFARLRFPGDNLIFYMFLLSLMIPAGVLVIPLFTLVRDLRLLDTRASLVLTYSSSGLAFSIFLLRAYFLSIPKELEEAAVIDGCSPLRTFLRIVMPIAKPGIAVVSVFQGMDMWNEFFLALVFVRRETMRTIPLGLLQFFKKYSTDWPLFFAAVCMTTIPIIALYICSQKQFIKGLTAGALKG